MKGRRGVLRELPTLIGGATLDSISVRGFDLAEELMGTTDFGTMAYLLVTGALPTQAQRTVFNASLIALADHGLTPTVIAARLTLAGAPDSLQGAVAAGLLGAGSVYLGVTENTATYLAGIVSAARDGSDHSLRDQARAVVGHDLDAGRRIPGLGHGIHRNADPRTARLYEIAASVGAVGPHLRCLQFVHEAAVQHSGRSLPVNGAGAVGAALADIGLSPEATRGCVLIARTAGLVAHLLEEKQRPLGHQLYEDIEASTAYRPALTERAAGEVTNTSDNWRPEGR